MNHLKLVYALVQSNLIVPLEPHIDWTGTLSGCSFGVVVEVSIAKARLVPQVTTQTIEDKLAVSILFLIHCEHYSVRVAELTVGVH